MNSFSRGDKVAFTLGRTNYLGTIAEANDTGDDYLVKDGNGTTWSVPADALALVAVETGGVETLATVTASDGATIDAVLDSTIRRYSVVCSEHQRTYTFYSTPASTEADHKKFRDDIVLAASKHVANHNDMPRPGHEGGQP